MSLEINRDMIKAFILNELSEEKMSLVADALIKDERLAKIHKEEKFKIDTKRYYDNEMNPTQRFEYESMLIKNMEIFSKVDQPKETSSSSEELLLKKQLEEAFKNYEASQEQPSTNTPSITIIKKTSISDRFKYWLAAASIFVLLIVGGSIGYNIQPSDSLENRLYADYYNPLGEEDLYLINNSSLVVAKQKYMSGDYGNALLLLKGLPASVTIEVERDLYIGLTLMQIGEYKEAINYFEGILANRSELNFIPQARWYLGLCYLKFGDRAKAIDTFQIIVNKNNCNYKKAKQILKKLRE
ncbi:MAG: tetratricopeptide repeat protein [Bacteroidales bacterium]|nr:tetratricopeptide repeat protein [Bacteroidales bacterium]